VSDSLIRLTNSTFYLKDNWPTDITKEAPTRDWLTAIGLKQYIQQFERQGCLTVGELEQLEAEDLEDMGVQKLGHAKRIWLALRKLRVGNFLIQKIRFFGVLF